MWHLGQSIQASSTEPPSDNTLDTLEQEVKRLREKGSQVAVETALGQVRALALRSTTPNAALVAALETLSDSAIVHNHKDTEHFKMVLKACRDNEGEGPLQTLITKLLGTEAANSPIVQRRVGITTYIGFGLIY